MIRKTLIVMLTLAAVASGVLLIVSPKHTRWSGALRTDTRGYEEGLGVLFGPGVSAVGGFADSDGLVALGAHFLVVAGKLGQFGAGDVELGEEISDQLGRDD